MDIKNVLVMSVDVHLHLNQNFHCYQDIFTRVGRYSYAQVLKEKKAK